VSPIPRRARTPKQRRRSRLHPLAIAALMIALIVFIVFYAFNQGLPFVGHYTLYAVAGNSVNVRSGSPVRIAGIDVGEVTGTSPDGSSTKITFTMQSNGLPVHTDATITIRDRLFLEGGYYLQLDPGTPDAPLVHSGFTIPQRNTASPVQFYQLLSTFTQPTRASLEDSLNTFNQGFSPAPGRPLSDSGAGGLKRAIPQLTPVLAQFAQISQALRARPGDLERLLGGSAKVASTLAGQSAQLDSLVVGLDRSSSALAADDGALAQTVSGIDATLKASPPALTAIDRALGPVATLSRALTPSLRIAPPLVSQVIRSVDAFNAVITPSRRGPLLTALRTTFATFPKLLTQFSGVFPVTKAVTDCLRENVTPVLDSEVQDGSLSSGQPAWKDFVHFLPNVAGATGNFDADGHYTRVLLGAGDNAILSGPLAGILSSVSTTLGGAASGLLGILPGGGGGVVDSPSPQWIGTLPASVFRPDVNCTSQKVPKLTEITAQADSGTPAAIRPATGGTP
jgi:virulence factor Mce-like protein